MNRDPLKKYLSISFLYVLLTVLVLAYRYFRYDQFSWILLSDTIGIAGVFVIGFYLLSKPLRRTIPQLNSWQETIELLGTIGIVTSLLAIRTPDITAVIAILLIFLIFYTKHLLKTSPLNVEQTLRSLAGVTLLLVLFFVISIERFIPLKDWFASILNKNISIRVTLLPPISVIIVFYIIIVLFIYLRRFFREPSGAESAGTPPPPTPVIRAPLIQPSPLNPASPTRSVPTVPPSTATVPQKSPQKM